MRDVIITKEHAELKFGQKYPLSMDDVLRGKINKIHQYFYDCTLSALMYQITYLLHVMQPHLVEQVR